MYRLALNMLFGDRAKLAMLRNEDEVDVDADEDDDLDGVTL